MSYLVVDNDQWEDQGIVGEYDTLAEAKQAAEELDSDTVQVLNTEDPEDQKIIRNMAEQRKRGSPEHTSELLVRSIF